MSKFNSAFGSDTAATPEKSDALEWENVMVEDLSPVLRKHYDAMLDARKAFQDAMIASAGKNKLIGKDETLLFNFKYKGRVGVAAAPIKRAAAKTRSKFTL